MTARDITISPGTRADLAALSRFHYRAGRPATIARTPDLAPAILRATDADGSLAGVLTLSMPVLNAPWRDAAWPGRFRTGDRARDASRLNRDLRCISRVIVDPRHRGLGVASTLVRTYLARPLTRCTEAIAAMGRLCPFFEAAGMTALDMPPPPRDARILDALAALALEPWELLSPAIRRDALTPWLVRELRLWARASRATRTHRDLPADDLARLAGARLSARPIAYAHGD